jgi:hypothetical protein
MGYHSPILTTEFAAISQHNRKDIAPDHCFTVGYAKRGDITAFNFLATAPTNDIRELFDSLVNNNITAPADSQGSLIIFHSSPQNAESENLINSKLPQLHFHVISGPLGQNFRHIEEQKTYVPHPKFNELPKFIKTLKSGNDIQALDVIDTDVQEAKEHSIIVHPGYSNLADFTQNASDNDIRKLAIETVIKINNLTKPQNGGGARIIIDERYNNTGILTIQVIGGEYLGQAPDPTHRWFEKPKTHAL